MYIFHLLGYTFSPPSVPPFPVGVSELRTSWVLKFGFAFWSYSTHSTKVMMNAHCTTTRTNMKILWPFTCILLHLFPTHLHNEYNRRNLILSIDFGDSPPNAYWRGRLKLSRWKMMINSCGDFFPLYFTLKTDYRKYHNNFFLKPKLFFFLCHLHTL